jgi:hypothetical protein
MTENVNTGSNSTATEVNLGTLVGTGINSGAQLLTVTTNGTSGYSLTATTSGHLVDKSVGYWIPDVRTATANDSPLPGLTIVSGTPNFGIHACGADVNTTNWGTNNCTISSGCLYLNPTTTYYYTLASKNSGPIIGTAGEGLTTVVYSGTVSASVPAGTYHTAFTYIATPVF